MHEFGSTIELIGTKKMEVLKRCMKSKIWTSGFKEYPHIRSFEVGDLKVKAGDTLQHIVNLDNPTGEELPYPAEMCTTLVTGFDLPSDDLCRW